MRKINLKRLSVAVLCMVMMLAMPRIIRADETDTADRAPVRSVEVVLGEVEFTEDLTMHELTSIKPDMSLRPTTRPWTDKVNNLWGVGLNGVNPNDVEYTYVEGYPYTLVNNGLASRIMVQFDHVIPRSLHEGEDPDDPEVFKMRSIDVPGQYKLKDSKGNVYYTYCCDAATDANLKDHYNGLNLENGGYYDEAGAQHIRYICMNGYWGSASGMGSLETFREFLVENGVLTEAEAAGLTHGEALTATQAAVWKFGNSSTGFAIDESIVVGPALNSYSFSSVDFGWRDNYVEAGNLVKKIYEFLIKGMIAPTPQTTVMTKQNSLIDIDINVKERVSEGTATDSDIYKADISFEIGNGILDSDELQVVISQDGAVIATKTLEADKSSYVVSDVELKENEDITLELNGSRQLDNGVYIFVAQEKSESQTLVGLAVGTQYVGLSRNVKFDVNYTAECVITGEKQMKHGELAEGQFSFELLDAEGEVLQTVENDGEGQITFEALEYTVEDLDNTDDEGCITYTVREVITDAEGIIFDTSEKTVKVRLTFEGEEFVAEVADDSDEVLFINDTEKTEIQVLKVWDDEDDQYKKRPTSVTIHLLANGEDTGSSVVLDESNQWSGSFTGLPTYEGEDEIIYSVEEDEVDGYLAEISEDTVGVFTVTNVYNDDTPPTGDRDPMGHWLMVFSAAAMALDVIWMKQGRREEEQ